MDNKKVHIDEKMRAVLSAIKKEGWEATTSAIKERTDIDNDLIRYRAKKLADADLAVLSRAEQSRYTIPPTVITLTNEGQKWVQDVLTEQGDAEEGIEEKYEKLTRKYERQQKVVNALARAVSEHIDDDFRQLGND